jgi:lipopolysaccharide transport system permease protein
MTPGHENYKELILRLAKTDFKLRYRGSVLGYVWAILRPLLLFTVLSFVFSSVFNFKNTGTPFYSLELITGLLLFQFFAEGTSAGMNALLSKAQLVTKIYVPRWTLVVSSTINSLFVFGMNLLVLVLFFVLYGKIPSIAGMLMFFMYVIFFYILILSFSFLTASLFVRFRDLSMIWDVLLSIIMYAAPIIYPLSIIPEHLQKILLINPVGFIIHFIKQALIFNHFASFVQIVFFMLGLGAFSAVSWYVFQKNEKKVAEYI